MNVSLDLELPRRSDAIPVLRHAVTRLCTEIGVSREDIDDLTIALSEACNNVVLHALEDDMFTVTFSLSGRTAIVVVSNAKTPFDPEVMALHDPVDDLSECGRGLAIMQALMDQARFSPSAGGGTMVELRTVVSAVAGTLLDQSPA